MDFNNVFNKGNLKENVNFSKMKTQASELEEKIHSELYNDKNNTIYLDYQFNKANTITLQSIYEEISIMWDVETKYRQGFLVDENIVSIPVIFAKISGVDNKKEYWTNINKLIVSNTYVVREKSFYHNYIQSSDFENKMTILFRGWLNKNSSNKNILNREKIKKHSSYKYGFLRLDMEDYIFDKIELLIKSNIIKNTDGNVEYKILRTLLNLDRDIIKVLQNFDFTKKIPKFICINTENYMYTLEESIVLAFLNLAGFDILLFTPTGFSSVEKYYNGNIINEYNIGEYTQNMNVPKKIKSNLSNKKKSFLNL